MTKFVSAVSGKGGAGKTTLVMVVAGEFALRGKSVLLVDSDTRLNLKQWWVRCTQKDNLPEGIELEDANSAKTVERILQQSGDRYDVVIMDSPGVDTILRNTIIRHSDVVLTPIQPAAEELRAAGETVETVAEIADDINRAIPQINVVTRVTMTNRYAEGYRLIRPFVKKMQDNGYDAHVLETELYERNVYRDIAFGYGSLQMMELNPTVRKARLEVRSMVDEISVHLGLDGESSERSVAHG